MPECEWSEQQPMLLALVITSVATGALCNLAVLSVFAWKWFSHLNSELRTKILPRLSFFILVMLAFERTVRLFSVSFGWYHLSTELNTAIYTVNNILAIFSIVGGLLSFLTMKLISSFEGSIHEIPHQQRKQLVGLIIVIVVMYNLFFIVNGIRSFKLTRTGRQTLHLIGSTCLVANLAFLAAIDFEFGKRLRDLVAYSAAHSDSEALQTPRLVAQSLPDSDEHSALPAMILGRPQLSTHLSITSIRRATVSIYSKSDQSLLKVAARSLLTALWISMGALFFFASIVLFSFGRCADYPTFIGHVCYGIATVSTSLSICVGMPHFQKEFEFWCRGSRIWLEKLVAWQTTNQMLHIREQQSHKDPFPNHRED